MNNRSMKAAVFSLAILAVALLANCGDDGGITVASSQLPDTLVDLPVTVPAGAGQYAFVSFDGTKDWRIRVTLTAATAARQPYGELDGSSGATLSAPPVETATNGTNTVDLTLPLTSAYSLGVFDGTRVGGAVRVVVARIQ
jgi:hypothetical protein